MTIQMDRHAVFGVGRKAAEGTFYFPISLMTNVVRLHVVGIPSGKIT